MKSQGATYIAQPSLSLLIEMLDMIKYLESLVGREIYVKTRTGIVKGVLEEVGRNGSLLLSNYEVVRGRPEESFNDRLVLIRGDNIVAVATEMVEVEEAGDS